MFLARVKGLFGGGRRDADFDAEVREHLTLLAEEYMRRGLSPADAAAAARREFGGVDQMKEAYRDQRSLPFIESFLQDLRYGARLLWRHKGFMTAAVLSLAIGIGSNTAIFSLVNLSLLKELPVRDPETLAIVMGYRTAMPSAASASVPAEWLREGHSFSYPMFRDLAAGQKVFSDMAASGGLTLAQFAIDGAPENASDISAGFVSANYFSMLGIRAAVGRLIQESDSRVPGEGAVAVIGHGFWERRFGRDPAIVGRQLTLNGVGFTVIGVAPRGFHGERIGGRRDLWIPLLMQPVVMSSNMLERRTSTWFNTFGRLAPGLSADQAAAQLTVLYRQLIADEMSSRSGSLINKTTPDQHRVVVAAGTHGINAGARERLQRPLLLLMGATGIVLLIACCNVANLLIARGTTRQRELAIRLAIGANRMRLVRQLLTESLLLSTLGAGLGVVVAQWTGRLLLGFVGLEGRELDLDGNVLIFAAFVALGTALLFGVVPAFQVTKMRSAPAAFATAFRETGSAPRRRVARGLVVTQVALSLWLLIGAGLVLRSLQNFNSMDIGLNRGQVLMVTLQSVKPLVGARAEEVRLELAARVQQMPEVDAVTFASYGLFGGGGQTAPVRVPDSRVDPNGDGEVRRNFITPGYFATVGMNVIRGRDFNERDTAVAAKVIVVNETMARHYFGDADPIGKIVYFPSSDSQGRYIPFAEGLDKAQACQIVGVVRDARFDNLRDPVRRLSYSPVTQYARGLPSSMLIRTSGEMRSLADTIRRQVSSIDPNLSVRDIASVEDRIANTLQGERTVATALTVFGGIALLLACVGLYGVMAYSVARRVGEIGVRVAMGATRGSVVRLVMRDTVVLGLLGVTIGVPIALATTHVLESLLFGLTPTDPATIATMVVVMMVVAALASLLPARRAARIDPMQALRCD
jgi:predicted permease